MITQHFISHWGSPQLLYGLLAILVLPMINWLGRRHEISLLKQLGANGPYLVGYAYHRPRQVIRTMLLCLGIATLVCSLARPRHGFETIELPTRSKSLMIAVDVSQSMRATDIKPSRLQRAIREILDLTDLWSTHEMGLIIFAGKAYVHLPLTQDLAMVRLFAKSLSVDMISEQGTDLGAVISLALANLSTAADKLTQTSKDLLIITDGEDHPNTVLDLANQAQAQGIRIFTMGLGSPQGAPIRLTDGSFKRHANGELVISKLDEPTLMRLAQMTQGHYVRSEAGRADLNALYQHGLKDSLITERKPEDLRVWNERYMWFGWLALLCFILSFLISPYQPKTAAAIPRYGHHLLLWLVMSGGVLSIIALLPYKTSLANQATDFRQIFNQATTQLTAADATSTELQAAETALLQLTRSTSPTSHRGLHHAAHYNLFHLYVKQGELQKAHQAILAAYMTHDSHPPTLENLKWITELIKQSQQDNHQNQNKDQDQDQNQSSSNSAQNNPTEPQATDNNQAPANSDPSNNPQSDSQPNPQQQQQANQHSPQQSPPESQPQPEASSNQTQQPSKTSSPPNTQPTHPDKPTDELADDNFQAQPNSNTTTNDDSLSENTSPAQAAAMAPDQAENLFRSLEENLEIYGRRHGHAGGSQDQPTKDW